jgi:hypothetical protein
MVEAIMIEGVVSGLPVMPWWIGRSPFAGKASLS